jgi:hypothetical protein
MTSHQQQQQQLLRQAISKSTFAFPEQIFVQKKLSSFHLHFYFWFEMFFKQNSHPYIVKLVYNDHPLDPKFVAVFLTGGFCTVVALCYEN